MSNQCKQWMDRFLICSQSFIDRAFAALGLIVLVPAISFWHLPLLAHEFWIEPVTARSAAGGVARFSLKVGEQFQGDLIGISRQQTVGLRHYSTSGMIDLKSKLPTTPAADFGVALNALGTHLIAYESEANIISLSADSFHAYLHEEGLGFVKTRREAAGTAKLPGRERYRRFVKTLVRLPEATGVSAEDTIFSQKTGQQLELTPLNNPLLLTPGGALRVRVDFEGQPLSGALVKAWHRHNSQTLIIRTTTGADGVITVNLPYSGAWMVSVVHMVPAKGIKNIDWDSLWGNLSFVMPAQN